MATARAPRLIPTPTQLAYLDFIRKYRDVHRRSPAEHEMQAFFGTTPPSVHNMVLTLEKRGFITRQPGVARSIQLVDGEEEDAPALRRSFAPTPSDLLAGHLRDLRVVFADQLAARLGRSAREIREEGLEAGDFGLDETVEVKMADGSKLSLRYAFVVVDSEQRRVGIFTEHCGYYCFPAMDLVVRELRGGKVVARRRW